MEINEFEKYLTLKSKNRYSSLRYTKEDIRLNGRRKRHYNILTKIISFLIIIEDSKFLILFRKLAIKIKNNIIKSKKYTKLSDCFSYKENMHNFTSNNVISAKDVIPKAIIVFDLLPKEFVEKYTKKYIKFREKVYDEKRTFSVRTLSDLRKSLTEIGTKFNSTSFGNLDYFLINKKHPLSEYFDSFSLDIIDLSPSFSSISYTLRLNEETLKIFEKIITGNVFHEGHFIDKGVKEKFNYSFSASMGYFDKSLTIEDYTCELKSKFVNVFGKEVFSTLDEFGIVLPNVSVYECNNVSSLIENGNYIKSIFNLPPHIFTNDSKTAFIQVNDIFFNRNHQKFNIYNAFIDNSLFGSDENGYADLSQIYSDLYYTFSQHYLVNALQAEYDKRISITNAKINSILQRKNNKFSKLIRLKKDTSEDFFLFDRLISEYLKVKKPTINDPLYTGARFKNISSFGNIKYFADSLQYLDNCLKKSYEGFSRITDFFEKQLKVVESHANYRTVKISLLVAILSLIVAIITFLLSNDVIFQWICDLFS